MFAIKSCVECGSPVSTKADSCPSCGGPVQVSSVVSNFCFACFIAIAVGTIYSLGRGKPSDNLPPTVPTRTAVTTVAAPPTVNRVESQSAVATQEARPAPVSKQWYSGGTLHTKSALDWQQADYDDKLATCSDFICKMWKDGSLVPRISNSINTVDDIKPFAHELVRFLDAATKKYPDPGQNRAIYVNQSVASMAGIGFNMMKWGK